MSDNTGMRRYSQLAAMSQRRLEELAEAGTLVPGSTFPKAQPQPAKRPEYTGPSRDVVALVRARSGGRCEFPGCRRPAQDRHHRYERGMGGAGEEQLAWLNLASNLLDSCRYHNDWASNRQPRAAEEMGWRLRHFDRPLLVAVQTRHDPDPIWLDDLGNWTTFDNPPEGVLAGAS